MVKKEKSSAKKRSQQSNNLLPANSDERKALEGIFAILLKSSRVDFSHYRHTTVLRRMSRRMIMCRQETYAEYLDYLTTNVAEVEKLYDDLLLSFTHFFRDPHIYETLKKKIFPKMVKNRSARTPIRIWVPGCSTGEEVYSLAICLYEFLEQSKSKAPVQFFGTDLVERHIARARAGLYPERITKDVSKERLEHFFDRTPMGLKVTKHIREMCVFAVQNITQDPPFSNIDMVSCRNVLIYFDAAFQETAIPLFHFSLRPSGFLLLGTSETMGKFPQFFNVIDQKTNLYSKRISRVKPDYKFPVYQTFSKLKNTFDNMPATKSGKVNVIENRQQINSILLDAYAPPGVLIDYNMQILQFVGHIFPYLGPVSGEASLKLSKMVGEGLMPDLYVAIEEVKKTNSKVKKKNISYRQNNKVIITDISILPIVDSTTSETNFLILFEKSEPPQALEESNAKQNGGTDNELSYLKQELKSTKEHLQSIIEEKDEVNQELWAANEEVQSTNEELQSVNEEMEAAKEELESSNEELLALNEELQLKNIEVTASKEFAENLLETANTIILTLDSYEVIKTFNKYAEELTGYKKEDVIGRKWSDLFIPLRDKKKMPLVFSDVLKTIPTVSQYENHIVLKSGMERLISWNNNVLRDELGNINGVLSIGMDITEHKLAQIEKINAQQYAAAQEKQALVGQVAGKIAHDFNNILGVIMGNAELSLMDCTDPEMKKTLELIFEQTLQGKNLTKNLVIFAKDQEIKQEFFKINQKINLVLDLLKKDLKNIELIKDFKTGLPSLFADSGMIEHSIVNLIQNSIHALGKVEHPRITIRTYCIDDSWVDENYIDENICFEIEDNGCGIPKEHLENIYLPSFTLKGSKDIIGAYNNEIRGTGYGMSNIKKYIEQHKGTISVESEPLKGAKFSIRLPIIKKELTNKEKEEISKSKSQFEKHILLVEDEPAIADIQHRILTNEPCNHNVDIAVDGQAAITLFKENNYDFISLDYVLPGDVNGMDIYNFIRETNTTIPILFISGNIEFLESIKELKQKDPNIDHLSKPCLNKEYLSSINELLERIMAKTD